MKINCSCMKINFLCFAAASFFGLVAPHTFAAPPLIAQKAIVVPGGPGGFDWMLVDAALERLYATHGDTKTLTVLDLKTGSVRQIATGDVAGVAVDAVDGKVFTGGGNQKVVILDNATLAKIGEVAVTGPVDDIKFDPKNGLIYADHDDGAEIWVIDPKTEKLVGSIAIAGAPEELAYDAGADRLYQNIKPAACVDVINPSSGKVVAIWPTAPMTSPHGLAVDSRTHRVLAAGQGKVVLLDQATGKLLSSADIAPGYVDQIALDQDKGRLYCACGEAGVISVVQEGDTGVTLLGTVPTHKNSHTLTVDPATHAVWISYSDDVNSDLQQFTLPPKGR